MVTKKREFGDFGENIAESYLQSKGYKIHDRNYRIKNIGEIDIVGTKRERITFFEVKTRDVKHETLFPIQTSINEKKKRNLKKICQFYLMDKYGDQPKEWQVDAIFIEINKETGSKNVNHLENILWEEYY